jgi:hypothetical protein
MLLLKNRLSERGGIMNLDDAKRIWGKEWLYDITIIDEVILHLGLSKNSRILQ